MGKKNIIDNSGIVKRNLLMRLWDGPFDSDTLLFTDYDVGDLVLSLGVLFKILKNEFGAMFSVDDVTVYWVGNKAVIVKFNNEGVFKRIKKLVESNNNLKSSKDIFDYFTGRKPLVSMRGKILTLLSEYYSAVALSGTVSGFNNDVTMFIIGKKKNVNGRIEVRIKNFGNKLLAEALKLVPDFITEVLSKYTDSGFVQPKSLILSSFLLNSGYLFDYVGEDGSVHVNNSGELNMERLKMVKKMANNIGVINSSSLTYNYLSKNFKASEDVTNMVNMIKKDVIEFVTEHVGDKVNEWYEEYVSIVDEFNSSVSSGKNVVKKMSFEEFRDGVIDIIRCAIYSTPDDSKRRKYTGLFRVSLSGKKDKYSFVARLMYVPDISKLKKNVGKLFIMSRFRGKTYIHNPVVGEYIINDSSKDGSEKILTEKEYMKELKIYALISSALVMRVWGKNKTYAIAYPIGKYSLKFLGERLFNYDYLNMLDVVSHEFGFKYTINPKFVTDGILSGILSSIIISNVQNTGDRVDINNSDLVYMVGIAVIDNSSSKAIVDAYDMVVPVKITRTFMILDDNKNGILKFYFKLLTLGDNFNELKAIVSKYLLLYLRTDNFEYMIRLVTEAEKWLLSNLNKNNSNPSFNSNVRYLLRLLSNTLARMKEVVMYY